MVLYPPLNLLKSGDITGRKYKPATQKQIIMVVRDKAQLRILDVKIQPHLTSTTVIWGIFTVNGKGNKENLNHV